MAKPYTRENQTERNDHEMEAHLRPLIEHAADLVLRLDLDSYVLYASPASRSMLGYEPDELREQVGFDFVHPEDLARARVLYDALRRGEEVEYTGRIRGKDGRYVWCEARAHPLRDPDTGAIQEIQAIFRDITERKRAEEERQRLLKALEVERNHLHQTVRQAPAFMVTLRGADHVFEYVNDRYHELTGHREMVGKPVREALPELEGQGYIALLDGVYRTGAPFEGREMLARLQRVPGAPLEDRYVDLVLLPLHEPDGTVCGILAHGIDVTEQVTARRRLEVLRRIDHAILSAQSSETIAAAALDHLQVFLKADRAAVLLFDYDARAISVLAERPEDGDPFFASRRLSMERVDEVRLLLHGTPLYVPDLRDLADPPHLLRHALDRGVRTLLVTPLMVQDECLGCLGITCDEPNAFPQDQQAVAQETADSVAVALQSSRLVDELRASQERLGALSRHLVHVQEQERRHLALELHDEVGQMLASLILALEQVASLVDGEEAHVVLGQAHSLIERLMNQVRMMSLDLRPSLLDDIGLLPAVLWYVHRYTERTGIDVEVKHAGLADQRLPQVIETTAYRIIQEALTNVARHTDAGYVVVHALFQNDMLFLRIEDTGNGFDPARAGVSGGLSGMRERAALVGGEVIVESAPGRGTTIIASLPVQHAGSYDFHPLGRGS